MTYRTPAPRYSRPIPPSKLPPLPGSGLVATLARAAADAIDREREDKMLRIGFGLGGLGVAAAVILSAARF